MHPLKYHIVALYLRIDPVHVVFMGKFFPIFTGRYTFRISKNFGTDLVE